MAKAYIRRALSKGLSLLGEAATLDGQPCGAVSIQQTEVIVPGIATTSDDNPVASRDVAHFDYGVSVSLGGRLVHPDGTYVIDRLLESNQYGASYIVTRVQL